MLVSLVAYVGFGLYGLINTHALIGKCLTETLYAAKDQPLLKNAWIATQENVSTDRYRTM